MAINFLSGIDVDNGVLYTDTANDRVGIGTTSPTALLTLESSSTSPYPGIDIKSTSFYPGGEIRFLNSSGSEVSVIESYNNPGRQDITVRYTGSTSGGKVELQDNAAILGAGTSGIQSYAQVGTVDFRVNTNFSTRMYINSLGNVGIGTTSPQEKLHVQNYTTGESHQAMFKGGAVTVGDYSYISLNNGYSTEYNKEVRLAAVSEQSNSNKTGFAVLTSPDANGASGHERLRVTADGDVGIGTTSPGYKLDVAGDLRVDNGNVGSTSGDEVEHVKIQGARHFLKFKEVRTANDSDWKNTTFKAQAGVDSTNHQSIDFVVDGSYAEHIDIRTGNQLFNTRFTSSGKVGIGTTSPASKLTIGGIGIGNTDGLKIEDPSNTAYGAHFSFDDASTTVEIGGVVNNTLRDCISIHRDATRTVTIDSNEKFGIGTTSPAAKLHVFGTTSSVPAIGAAPSAAQLGGSSYGTLFSTLTSGRGVIQQGRSDGALLTFDLLLNPRGGNVGIGVGTSVPAYTLDVYGTGRFTGDLRCLSLIQTSERDYKKDIRLVGKENSTIPIKEYKYKTGDNDKVRYGVVAEDIESTYPELVERDADGVKGVKYIDLLVRKIAELETEKRTLVNWRHYHSNTSYNTLYDTGMTTAFPYAYGSIPAPYDMYFTSITLVNNPYSSYNKGPLGDTATFQAYVNGKLAYEIREIRYGQNPYETITADFGQNVRLRRGESLQIRFQANGTWRYCNSTIILTEI